MSSINSVSKSDCEKPGCDTRTPCCPNCGAVECLCRPRFFAGQLLSEQDLNRLDQYIKNKNRLHNRNQHGWGVVNGLKVLCDPCGDVLLTEGYAVDPCGDDIVVCEQTRVNICELIRKCKQSGKFPDCETFSTPANANCDEREEEWVLSIKYEEWPSRGITALRGNSCSSGKCASGACSSCGACSCNGACSCGSSKQSSRSTKTMNTMLKNRASPPECEATVVCESFSFAVYPKPETDPEDDDDESFSGNGSFAEIFRCCMDALTATMPPMPDLSDPNSTGQISDQLARDIGAWCCRFRDNLLKYFTTNPNTSCEIIDYLKTIICPNANNNDNFVQDFINAYLSLFSVWAEGVKICLCLALLPPTPAPGCDTRVPLATVKIRARDCKVLSICNWTIERKIMVTWPAMGHWLGIFSISALFRNLLDSVCCRSLLGMFDNVIDNISGRQGMAATDSSVPGTQTATFANAMNLASADFSAQLNFTNLRNNSRNLARFISASDIRGGKPLQLGALLNSVSPRFKLPANGQQMQSVEANNIPLLLLSEMVVKPVLRSFVGDDETGRQTDALGKRSGDDESQAVDLTEMKKQLDSLRTELDIQSRELAAVKNQLNSFD